MQMHNGVPHNTSSARKVWRKVKKTILVDSRDRQVTGACSPGQYNVVLPAVYSNIYSITLRSYEIPLTYNTFAACQNNTSMMLQYTPYGGSLSNITVTIPDGNYTTTTLPQILTTVLSNSVSAGVSATWSQSTGRTTIASTNANDSIVLLLNQTPGSVNCGATTNVPATTGWGLGYFLGFYPHTYTSINGSITGSFLMNPSPDTYILMELGGLNKLDETGIDGRIAGRIDGSFAKVPVTQNSGEYMFFADSSGTSPLNQRIYNPPIARLDRLAVRWRRHDGRTIDFNGAEHSFTLELELLDNNFDEYSSLEFSR